jgi:hypothetical protein
MRLKATTRRRAPDYLVEVRIIFFEMLLAPSAFFFFWPPESFRVITLILATLARAALLGVFHGHRITCQP